MGKYRRLWKQGRNIQLGLHFATLAKFFFFFLEKSASVTKSLLRSHPPASLSHQRSESSESSAKGLRSGGEQCCCPVICCYLMSSKKASALTLTFIKSLLHKREQVQHFFSLLQLTQLPFLLNAFFGQQITPCQPLKH